MNRFRYTIPVLLLLGILGVAVAGFYYATAPTNNPSTYIPTFIMGILMITLAIILTIIAKRETLERT